MSKTIVILGLFAVGLVASTVNATVIMYEMGVMPDAEAVSPMLVGGGGAGDAGTGLLGDGTARFTDTSSSGNKGYFLNGTGGTLTMDMRVKANLDTVSGSSTRRSMSVYDGANGRGIRIEKSGLTLVDGGGGDKGKAAVDISAYHMIRVTVSGGNANIYDLESTPGAWTLLVGPVALGGSGFATETQVAEGGIGLNSLGGGSTSNSDFELDWLRLDVGTDRGATGAIIPEPAALALMLVGGLPLLRRRR